MAPSPVCHHACDREEQQGGQQPDNDDPGDKEAPLAGKALNRGKDRHIIEPRARIVHNLGKRQQKCLNAEQKCLKAGGVLLPSRTTIGANMIASSCAVQDPDLPGNKIAGRHAHACTPATPEADGS